MLLLPALAGACAMGLAAATPARAAPVCADTVAAKDAKIDRTMSCAEADVSRYFLISSDLKALSDDQRVDVLQRPAYYTLAYMAAALTNDIQADFAKAEVQSATYAGVIAVRGAGGKNVDNSAFTVSLDRKTEQAIDWKTFAPMSLFSLPGAQQTPWLKQTLAGESAAK